MSRRHSMFLLLAVLAIAAVAQPAAAQCPVAVVGGDPYPGELQPLHTTLTGLGFTWVDIATVADAQAANAKVIIDRYDVTNNLPAGDVTTWLNTGKGYVELGDWPQYFANKYVGIPAGGPITITVTDPSSPLALGLPASWTGLGFWAYNHPGGENYIAWVTDPTLPDVMHAQYVAASYDHVVSSEIVGTGRAVFIGFNVYGTSAGPNDIGVLRNGIGWAGHCGPWAQGPEIPALGSIALPVLIILIALLGAALIARLR